MMFKKGLNLLIISFALVTSSLKPIEIDGPNLFVSEQLGQIKLFHDDNGFQIMKDGNIYDVQNCFVDKELRGLSEEKLKKFLGLNKPHLVPLSDEQIESIKWEDAIPLEEKQVQEILKLVGNQNSIKVGQLDDGEYTLKIGGGLKGGGAFGAWFGAVAGKFIVSGLCHGTIFIVGSLTGPAAPFVITGLEATLGPTIEIASTTVALATGITGAVMTGPV